MRGSARVHNLPVQANTGQGRNGKKHSVLRERGTRTPGVKSPLGVAGSGKRERSDDLEIGARAPDHTDQRGQGGSGASGYGWVDRRAIGWDIGR